MSIAAQLYWAAINLERSAAGCRHDDSGGKCGIASAPGEPKQINTQNPLLPQVHRLVPTQTCLVVAQVGEPAVGRCGKSALAYFVGTDGAKVVNETDALQKYVVKSSGAGSAVRGDLAEEPPAELEIKSLQETTQYLRKPFGVATRTWQSLSWKQFKMLSMSAARGEEPFPFTVSDTGRLPSVNTFDLVHIATPEELSAPNVVVAGEWTVGTKHVEELMEAIRDITLMTGPGSAKFQEANIPAGDQEFCCYGEKLACLYNKLVLEVALTESSQCKTRRVVMKFLTHTARTFLVEHQAHLYNLHKLQQVRSEYTRSL